MPHATFGAVRRTAAREPLTFDFGIYGEETFTVVPEPSLGDCFALYDAPDLNVKNDLEAARLCARFIESMLTPEDRPRFRAALLRIPAPEAHVIYECAAWITEQVAGFPTTPPVDSSTGRRSTGTTSKRTQGGTHRSKR